MFASQWRALLLVSAFLITLCNGPLFWGMQHTPSGVAGVVNLSLLPVGLLLVGVALRVETLTVVKSLGVLLGVIGLAGRPAVCQYSNRLLQHKHRFTAPQITHALLRRAAIRGVTGSITSSP